MFLQLTIVLDERPCLDFSYNMVSNRKIYRSDVSGMSILGGISPFRYKVINENPVSGGHFVFHAPVILCH